jgi:hypothetical protein
LQRAKMSPQEEDATDTVSAATRQRNHDAPTNLRYTRYALQSKNGLFGAKNGLFGAKKGLFRARHALRSNNALFGAKQQRNIAGIVRHDMVYPPPHRTILSPPPPPPPPPPPRVPLLGTADTTVTTQPLGTADTTVTTQRALRSENGS